MAPDVGARPDRRVPVCRPSAGRHRAVGPRRQGRRTPACKCSALPRRDSCLRVDRHVRPHRASTSTSPTSASSSAIQRDQAARLGRRAQGRRASCEALREHVGSGRAADVRRFGRLRPPRRHLPGPGPRQRRGLPLVRGADARVQHQRLPAARRARRRTAAGRRDVRRCSHEHRRLHRLRRGHLGVRTSTRLQRRHHRRDAHRPPRRFLSGCGPRCTVASSPQPPPVHVDPEHDLLRVAGQLQSRGPRARMSTRTVSCTRPRNQASRCRPDWTTRPRCTRTSRRPPNQRFLLTRYQRKA